MNLKFEKWHGARNDFIVVWLPNDQVLFDSLQRLTAKLCSRNGTGIGADGVIVLHNPSEKDKLPDRISIINSDGSLAETCGNGIRCAAASVIKFSLDNSQSVPEELNFKLRTSEVQCSLLGPSPKSSYSNSWPLVSVRMGVPLLNEQVASYSDVAEEVKVIATRINRKELLNEWSLIQLSNNHLVFFGEQFTRTDLLQIGPAFQDSKLWDGINVHLCQTKFLTNRELASISKSLGTKPGECYSALVWERGAGETQACGSGACAIATTVLASGFVNRKDWIGISMPGGILYTMQKSINEPINLAGPAAFVFEGIISI